MKGVALSAEKFEVISYRDGHYAALTIINGEVDKYTEGLTEEPNGTYICFTPSQEVYNLEPINIDFDEVCQMCQDWAYLNKNLAFDIVNENTNKKISYCYKHGILDFVKSKIPNSEPIYYETQDEKGNKIEIAFQWGAKHESPYVFTNGIQNVELGTPATGAKTAIARTINNALKAKYSGETIRGSLCYVMNCKVLHPSFSDQTKRKVNTPELRSLADKAFTEAIKDFIKKKPDEFRAIGNMLNKIEKAEVAADRARKAVLEAAKDIEKNQKKKVFASDKLKDAEKLGQDSMLLCCEGLSASSSIAMARDLNYGILALRGKILNCFTADEEKIAQNEEIKLLLSAMNITPGKYDSKKLRYGKIGILVDADSDGFSIGLLIMCVLYHFAPQFVEEGRLYWVRTPLYIVKTRSKEYYYFSDEEYNQAKGTIKGEVTRAKGIGALSPTQAHNSMFDPEIQRLDRLIPNKDTYELLSQLMGKDAKPKHDFIFNNLDFSIIRE